MRMLPGWVHAVPYVALVALGIVLLIPSVVPHGPECGNYIGAASRADRETFIRLSAVAFGLVAALAAFSALAAGAQRRIGRPGLPTVWSTSLVGAATLAAVVWPHAPAAAPAQAVMVIVVGGLAASGGAAIAIPAVAGVLAWAKLAGPRSLRGAQIGAWILLLVVLPVPMALTYMTVTPICFG